MTLIHLELAEANEFVDRLHRHHKPVRGHRFSLGASRGTELVGVAIVGRPVSRGCDPKQIVEVTRLCTDGSKNVCSFLYSAAARAARSLGYSKIQTYILESETGISLIAAGWEFEGTTRGGDWNGSKANSGTRRTDQPMCPKQRWSRRLI
jgi:hypothetical protein